jgi:hypothetical protein
MMRRTDLSTGNRIIKAFAAGTLGLGLIMIYIVPPSRLLFANCAFHSITGHSCLTCGMTRSLHAISRGEFATSVRYHLFGPAVFIATLLCLTIFAAEAIRGKKSSLPLDQRIRSRVFLMVAILWLAYWTSRLVAEFAA